MEFSAAQIRRRRKRFTDASRLTEYIMCRSECSGIGDNQDDQENIERKKGRPKSEKNRGERRSA